MSFFETFQDTDRLRLIPISEDWAEDIYREFTPQVTQMMYAQPPETLQDTLDFIERSLFKIKNEEEIIYVIIEKKTNIFLGICGVHHLNTRTPVFGLWIKESAWGNHYGFEAIAYLAQIIENAFDIDSFLYDVQVENTASEKIARRLGGHLIATFFQKNQAGQRKKLRKFQIPKPSHRDIFSSPIGDIELIAEEEGLRSLRCIETLNIPFSLPHRENPHPLIMLAQDQLSEYFAGKRRDFSLPLCLNGTSFQKNVWNTLQKIPYGKTLSYSDVANIMKNPGAVRAVGGANNKNQHIIVIPCHRIIGANGDLVGYGPGIEKKKWLLDFEMLEK